MASIHKEFIVDATPEQVWAVLADFGAPAAVIDVRAPIQLSFRPLSGRVFDNSSGLSPAP
ncbi:hypothetical protein [Nocardia sp. NPDC050793]|uniref:hypothetical protein n=1 Tax=Nocardia sp. NPDC050793 TaxID=3155159 RepID=UPI0033F4E222